ncbi:MAG: large conductance mechanosensitive channel protein MscL [Clostridiaceae bacterium]|jgi:large conductance mechanosensitive channel|nr:large conductance mechanosensitive channel protein MscL [Bacillota bacterium]NLI38161.1 large conductance mechanosensitive channel protein MscL [Clostridiaceae bacterium]
MMKDFKKFAIKGNIIDLAIGVIIGGAFGKIVTSLVNDIIMPAIGILLGKIDFSNLVLEVGDAAISYGLFINNVVDFLIISFSIYFVMKKVSKFTRKKDEAPTKKKCKYCCTEIDIKAIRCPHCTSVLEETT